MKIYKRIIHIMSFFFYYILFILKNTFTSEFLKFPLYYVGETIKYSRAKVMYICAHYVATIYNFPVM